MKCKKVAAFVMAAVMVFQQTAVTTIAEEQTLDVNQAADMCMEENAAEACMEVSEQTENSEGQALSESAADESGQAETEIFQNTASLGGSTTSERYPHDVPDYFGKVGGGKNITTVSDIPVYLGEEELGNTFTLVNEEGKNYFDYYFTSQFIDFGTTMAALQGEAEGFKGVDVDLTSKEKKDGYEISGSTVKLDVGGLYEFTAKELQNIQVLDIQGDFGGGSDTFIIVKDGGSVKLPKTMNNGKELGSIEAGMTGSVVFLVPNAKTVTGNAVSGHVVAPSADVELGGGYFNGCVIAKSFHANAEGHKRIHIQKIHCL